MTSSVTEVPTPAQITSRTEVADFIGCQHSEHATNGNGYAAFAIFHRGEQRPCGCPRRYHIQYNCFACLRAMLRTERLRCTNCGQSFPIYDSIDVIAPIRFAS